MTESSAYLTDLIVVVLRLGASERGLDGQNVSAGDLRLVLIDCVG